MRSDVSSSIIKVAIHYQRQTDVYKLVVASLLYHFCIAFSMCVVGLPSKGSCPSFLQPCYITLFGCCSVFWAFNKYWQMYISIYHEEAIIDLTNDLPTDKMPIACLILRYFFINVHVRWWEVNIWGYQLCRLYVYSHDDSSVFILVHLSIFGTDVRVTVKVDQAD